MYERIVIPLEGSERVERALLPAAHLARLTGTPLHVVRVVDADRLTRYGPHAVLVSRDDFERVAADEGTAARGYLSPVAQDLADRALAVTVEVAHGDAAAEVIRLVRPGDLIVMASHGRGGVARWCLGSSAEAVVRHSPVPIRLIRIRPPSAAADGARWMAPSLAG